MASRRELLHSVAEVLKDYREGDHNARITSDRVAEWVEQLRADVRDPVLSELAHVLKHSYISKRGVKKFLAGVATSAKIAGSEPKKFWKRCQFLNIQQGGASQAELLELFDSALEKEHDLAIDECDSDDTFIYFDDVIFSGSRLKTDLTEWVETAPKNATVHVIVIAAYSGGEYYAGKNIEAAAKKAKKKLKLKIWRMRDLENRKSEARRSDVLWPKTLPEDELVRKYAAELKAAGHAPILRPGNSTGNAKHFSSPENRAMLESEFLRAGVVVRKRCKRLHEVLRPLGFSVLKTFGFGSLTVTYRNCPNTCPLVLWAGDPWFPLFARKTNTQTASRSFDD